MKTLFMALTAIVIIAPIAIIEFVCKLLFAIVFSLFKPIFKKSFSYNRLEAFAYEYGFKRGYYPLTDRISEMYG